MTTALDVVKTSLRSIQVIDAGEEPEASEGADALQAMNLMIHGWRNKGVDVGHTDLVLTDELKLDPRHHEAVIYLLAVRLAPEYEKAVSVEVATLAEAGWRGLQSHYIVPNDLKIEGLEQMPSRRHGTLNV
jgi:hypothetical protein